VVRAPLTHQEPYDEGPLAPHQQLRRALKRTLFDECFPVQGRTKCYAGPDEIERLDIMAPDNFRRTHQGNRVAGRMPAKGLYDLISAQWLSPLISDAAPRRARLAS
jgi:hypothetical protein